MQDFPDDTPSMTIHPIISKKTSRSISHWRDELNLRRTDGKKLSVTEICTIIIVDFAEEYEETKKLMLNEEK